MTFSNQNQLKNDSTYVFIIKCKAVKGQDGSDVEAGKTYSYTNNASVELDGVKVNGSDKQTQEWTKYKPADPVTKVLDKSGDWDGVNRKMRYSVKINPDGKKFFSDTFNSLKLDDVLTVSKHPVYIQNEINNQALDTSKVDVEAVLDTESVKLYYAKKDAEGNLVKDGEVIGWTLQTDVKENQHNHNQNDYKITLDKVPNGQPLILEYVYQIANNATEVYPNTPDRKVGVVKIGSLSNEITLGRTDEKGHKDTGELSWDESMSSVHMWSGRVLTVVKTEAGNSKKTLKGAVFTLQKYNNGVYEDVNPAKTYTTNDGGVIQIKQGDESKGEYVFAENTLYRLIETTAPNGYLPVADMTPAQKEGTAVYFFFGEGTGADQILPIQPRAIDLNETSATIRVENVPNTTSIAVRKAWKNADGTDADAGASNIIVQLHQVAYRNEPNETGYGVGLFECAVKRSNHNAEINGASDLANTLGVQPAGTTFNLTITTKFNDSQTDSKERVALTWNGVVQSTVPSQVVEGEYYHKCVTTYTYTLKVKDGINTLNTVVDNTKDDNLDVSTGISDITAPVVEMPIEGSDTTCGDAVTLNGGNNWQHVFENLPLKGTYNGETVHYAYYALETKMDSTDVSKDGGTYGDWTVTQGKTPITSGTITIVNTKKPDTPDSPGYELPATGSTGTAPYTTAGAVLMGAALVGGYRRKRRQERRGE